MVDTLANPKIETRGLIKEYGKRRVVNKVDIHVNAGEIVGLLGPNGAGKTTTFYMVVGLVPATEGRVFLNDDDLTNLPMYRRARFGIGYLPQEASVFRKMTVEQNIRAIAETMPFNKAQREDCVEQHLDDLGLTHLAKQKAYTLSGGERRRVEIGRALVLQPEFLLLDEPCSALDPIATGKVEELIRDLRGEYSILIVTHNMQQAARVSDRTAFFTAELDERGDRRGRLVEFDETSTIFSNPADERTEAYVTGRFG